MRPPARTARLASACLVIGLTAVLGTVGCAARPLAPHPPVAVATASGGGYRGSLASGTPPGTSKRDAEWPGAAGRVLDCATAPVGGTRLQVPFEGEDDATTPAAALATARRWGDWNGVQSGFVLERISGPRRLYVFRSEGRAKQALILRHGPALKGDGTRTVVPRWWLESWARCDWSELPADVAEDRGLQVWTDRTGHRVPTTAVVSFTLPADCFSGVTLLDHGEAEYVRNAPRELHDFAPGRYVEHVTVPADAVDSGYRLDAKRLWWAADGGSAFVGAPHDAESWPRAVRPIRCS